MPPAAARSVSSAFWGLRRILTFNRRKTLFGIGVALSGWALFAAPIDAGWLRWIGLVVAAVTTHFLAASVFAAWYVYDHSSLYEWHWIRPLLPSTVTRATVTPVSASGDTATLARSEVTMTVARAR